MRKVDEALSRLGEVEAQLNSFNRYSLLNEPKLPKLLATDVRKAREVVQELVSILDASLGDMNPANPTEVIPADLRDRIQRVKVYVEG